MSLPEDSLIRMSLDPTITAGIAVTTFQEVRNADFGTFRAEEMDVLADQNPLTKVHIEEGFTSFIQHKGPEAADQFISGALYATRLLRAMGVPPMIPSAGMKDHEFACDMGTMQFTEARVDVLFAMVFGNNPELIVAAMQFSNPNAKQGAYMVIFMHREVIPGALPQPTKTSA